jgi:hypothetical protein
LDDLMGLCRIEEVQVGQGDLQELFLYGPIGRMFAGPRLAGRDPWLKNRIGEPKLRDNAGAHRRARTCRARAQTVLERVAIDIANFPLAVLQIPIMLVETHAGLKRRQPEHACLNQPRVGFANPPLSQRHRGMLPPYHRQRGR